jgi:hypothetical protein
VYGKKFVPWICHICTVQFDIPLGGICSQCKQPTCVSHLHPAGDKRKIVNKRHQRFLCTTCVMERGRFVSVKT